MADGVGAHGLPVGTDHDLTVDDADLDAPPSERPTSLVRSAGEADAPASVDEAGDHHRGVAHLRPGPAGQGVDGLAVDDPGAGLVTGHVADDEHAAVEDLYQGVTADDLDGHAGQPS